MTEYDASVIAVHQSSGVRKVELAWTRGLLWEESDDDAFRVAAETWWDETDQCAEAEVTIVLVTRSGERRARRMKIELRRVGVPVGPDFIPEPVESGGA